MDVNDITTQSRAPLSDENDGDAIDLSTPEGLDELFDLLVRAECAPGALARRAGISITELARIVTQPENLSTMRKLTQMYEIYRAALAARLKTHALAELSKSAECPFASSMHDARGMDVARKACVDLLRCKEQSPLLATPPRRRIRKRRVKEPTKPAPPLLTAPPVNGAVLHSNGAAPSKRIVSIPPSGPATLETNGDPPTSPHGPVLNRGHPGLQRRSRATA